MELSSDQLEEIKARDARFRAVDVALQLAAELRVGTGLKLFLEALEADAWRAMEDFASLSLEDTTELAKLQVVVRTFTKARDTFGKLMIDGAVAENDLRLNDLEDS